MENDFFAPSIPLPVQATAFVTVASVSVHRTGRARTATAPDERTPACPTWGCCAAAGASVCAAPVNAPSQVLTEPHVTSAPPAPTPAPWRSESERPENGFKNEPTAWWAVCFSAWRECVECKHFKRGKLYDDSSCSRICKDEIEPLDELGETHWISIVNISLML